DHAGGRLPDPRERDLHHGTDPHRGDALPRRDRRAARPLRRHLRHGHHHQSHQPRVLFARHRAPERAQGVNVALALILVPLAFAAIALVMPSDRWRPWMVPAGGAVHFGLLVWVLLQPGTVALGRWLQLDSLGKLVLGFVSVLHLLCAFYAPGYLAQRPERKNSFFC